MNSQIRGVGVVLLVLFSAVFIQLSNLQVLSADRLNDHPANTRAVVRDFSRPRGSIASADGVVLAESVPADNAFKLLRRYPEAELFGHLTGYFSFTYGSEGVERTYNDVLVGERNENLSLERLGELLVEREHTSDITLTVSKDLQKLAFDSLAGRKGAVAAVDPRDGSILALASYPSYDPNPLAAHDQAEVREAWSALNANTDRPLLARSFRERYFPGSSFKVVTAAAALTADPNAATGRTFPVLTELPLPQGSPPLKNFGGSSCGGNLVEALRVSCNTAFAQLGMDLGGARMQAAAEGFGFNQAPPVDLPGAARSVFPEARVFSRDRPALAKSAIGQQDVQAAPLQMALVAAGVANGGVVMTPHVLSEIRSPEAEVLGRFQTRPWKQAMSPEAASTLTEMMVRVVDAGSGTRARIPGMKVAGKTGTAQTGLGQSHVWFVAFAPAEAPRVAVAVMLENQPSAEEATGGALAAPIAKAVMERALARSGVQPPP